MNSNDPFHDVDAGLVGISRCMGVKAETHVINKPPPELPDTEPKPKPHFRIETEVITKPAPEPEAKRTGKPHTKFEMQQLNPSRNRKSKVPPSIGSMYP